MNKDKTNNKLIAKHLQKEYGLIANKISKGSRGFVAETYIIKVSNKKYFVKMVKKGRYDHNLVQSVEILRKLCQFGLKQVSCPIASISGSNCTDLNKYTFILFKYIEGEWTFDYKNEELLDIIVELHKIDPKVAGEIKKEDFELPYNQGLMVLLENVFSYNSKGVFEMRSRQYLEPFKKEIYQDWKNFNKLISMCKTANFDLRITHEDPWGNVMRSQKGNVYLFDWDNIALAPVERDLWFKLNNQKVIDYYQKSFPEYKVNKLAYDFYSYNRYFYDLYGFLVEIFSDRPEIHKEENYKLIIKDWNDWLRILVREITDKY